MYSKLRASVRRKSGMRTVVHFIDSGVFGGAEQVLLQILAGFDRQRWRPVLFYHSEPGVAPLLERALKLQVKTQAVPRMERIWDTGQLPQFIRALHGERPSILHAHLTWPLSCKYGILAAAMARVPAVVATAHTYRDLSRKPLLHMLPCLIARGVDRYLAVSRSVADQLSTDFGIPASKVKLVYNGIPTTRFDRPANSALRDRLTGATAQPIVLTVARLDKQKGQRYLIEAATQVPKAMFVLVGDGPDRQELEAQARTRGVGDRVLFLGYREDVADLLACCDLFVLPSLYEGLPLSILEAMAAGKPVIASAIGGNDEVVAHGGTGLLVPPADPVALSGAIRSLLSDPVLARRLAKAGKAWVNQEFTVETMVQHVMQVYDEILDLRELRHAHFWHSL